MSSTSFTGFSDDSHQCREAQYFKEHIREYAEKESHENKSLKKHVEEVLDAFNRTYFFYNFDNKALLEIGHYLAYYHDLGKLDEKWDVHKTTKPAHSPLSVSRICQENIEFETQRKLFPLLLYLIYRHHGNLVPPEKMNVTDRYSRYVKTFMCEYWTSEFLGTDSIDSERIDIADIFGLFKIADALSAADDGSKQFLKVKELLDKNPQYSEDDVKSMISRSFQKDRWRQQLRIKHLPQIGMLCAPTGWGKTTVSLLFSIDKNRSRVFYLLPTTTAINKFYGKMCQTFGNDVSKYFYFYDTEIKEDDEKLQTLYFVQNFLSPIVLTTVDQFLLSFLQVGKYFTKRVSFRNSVLVFDEIHLLNPVMLEILNFFLATYKEKYGLKCLLMSATFPKAYAEYFMKELDISNDAFLDFGDEYKQRKRVMFDLHKCDIIDGAEDIYNAYKKCKRVLVVVNTVEKAVLLAKKLREEYCKKEEQDDVILLHARFMYKDRKQTEEKIDQLEISAKPHILVSTQVCEVSLDISYDLLYTELASLGALMQRFGRVNRYDRWTEKQNVNIYKPKELTNIDTKHHYPYEPWEMENSWQVLTELKMNKMSNEKQLIDCFDETLPYDDLEEELDRTGAKFRLKVWEDLLRNFYSLDLQEDDLRPILHYRESFKALIIPSPSTVNSESKKGKMTQKIIEEFIKKLEGRHRPSFTERLRLIATAKEISVPIPIWWLKGRTLEKRAFPVIEFYDRMYDPMYGFVPYANSTIL